MAEHEEGCSSVTSLCECRHSFVVQLHPSHLGGKVVNSQLSPPQVMLENGPKWAWFKKQREVAAVHKPQSRAGGFGALSPSLLLGERLENLRVILFLMLNAWFPSSAVSWWRFWSRSVFSPNTSRILQAKARLLKAACAHVRSPAGC